MTVIFNLQFSYPGGGVTEIPTRTTIWVARLTPLLCEALKCQDLVLDA